MALILDCPVCLHSMTTVDGTKPDLVGTPCGHLYHSECLNKIKNKCIVCKKGVQVKKCYQYYPEISEEDKVVGPETPMPTPRTMPATTPKPNLLGLPPLSAAPKICRNNTNPTMIPTLNTIKPQEIGCSHHECHESGQINASLVQDYQILVPQCNDLDNQIAKNLSEMDRLKQTLHQNEGKLDSLEPSKRDALKRKLPAEVDDQAENTSEDENSSEDEDADEEDSEDEVDSEDEEELDQMEDLDDVLEAVFDDVLDVVLDDEDDQDDEEDELDQMEEDEDMHDEIDEEDSDDDDDEDEDEQMGEERTDGEVNQDANSGCFMI